MDAEAEGEDEIHPSKRQKAAERIPTHVPPEVEPENHDFDVNELSRDRVAASVFVDPEIIRRAAVRQISCYEIPLSELWR